MSFPPGRVVLVLLAVALGCAVTAVLAPTAAPADLTVWVFDDTHAAMYAPLAEQFSRDTGKRVGVSLIGSRALDVRLLSLLNAGERARPQLPDLVEVEIGSAAKYFRPPPEQIGLLPLNDLLAESAWLDRLSPGRVKLWTCQGQIFGVPLDVHPVSLTYRKDLFEQAGIDLPGCKTWEQFQDRCLAFQRYWPGRRAIGLSSSSASDLLILLQQRRVQLLDDAGCPHLQDEVVAQTLAWYARAVAGSRAIAGDVPRRRDRTPRSWRPGGSPRCSHRIGASPLCAAGRNCRESSA